MKEIPVWLFYCIVIRGPLWPVARLSYLSGLDRGVSFPEGIKNVAAERMLSVVALVLEILVVMFLIAAWRVSPEWLAAAGVCLLAFLCITANIFEWRLPGFLADACIVFLSVCIIALVVGAEKIIGEKDHHY